MRSTEWLFVVALVMYSTAIWADRFRKELRPWMIWAFGLGLCADLSGTVLLCASVAGAWKPTLHMITGSASLLIMALHFLWAVLASRSGSRSEQLFRRWSLAAWLLWLVSFLSGAFLH